MLNFPCPDVWWNPGPDQGWSWVILFATFLLRFCSQATQTFSTIMFPTIVNFYGVQREIAAWPFTLRLTLRSFSGILAAVLVKYFTVRKVTYLYSALQVIGYVICYLGTYEIYWLQIGNGLVNGTGLGLMDACTIIILNDYFVKSRVMSNSIMYSSTTISGMIQPLLGMWLLNNYEIRGSFLFFAAWAAQSFIGAALLRPRDSKHFPRLAANDRQGASQYSKVKSDVRDPSDPGKTTCWSKIRFHKPRRSIKEKCGLSSESSSEEHLEDLKNKTSDDFYDRISYSDLISIDLSGSSHNIADRDSSNSIPDKEGQIYDVSSDYLNSNSHINQNNLANEITHQRNSRTNISPILPSRSRTSLKNGYANSQKDSKLESASSSRKEQAEKKPLTDLGILKQTWMMMSNPVSVIILISSTLILPLNHTFSLVIMDHALLYNVPATMAIMLVPVQYITELLVRFPLSWIIEKEYIAKRHFYTIIMLDLSLGLFLVAFFHNVPILFLSAALVGIYTSLMHSLRIVIMVEYLGLDCLAIMHGLVSFFNGCSYLIVPKIIGLLFPINGNYKFVFAFLGTVSLVAVTVWQFVELVAQRRKKKNGL